MINHKFLIGILIFGLFAACKKDKIEFIRNEKLIGFKSWTVMDMDELADSWEQNYKVLTSDKFNPKTDTIKFEKGYIYISYLSFVNGCGQYAGDIEMKTDSVILKLVDTVGIGCTELRCDRLVYKIKNNGNKKYVIKKW